ncbi:MAG TPA: bacillithiol biosynthesis deacetylase BshB1 [Ferruginibacter sp.]|nr:bacillithiol biosynthesis deacetylase BshB1 [Ferruginibacter sp.]HNL66249.1 bacillithiol biosynthesis deacetylase BshB1 [Ferruginibacter sp.]HNP00251.1 bacillithiol biosynthesis deacetylase BshB1 [Ferruginibacter sp.]
MKLDVLAFGVHPDDVELSCAGALLVEKKNGKHTGIIDLTEGELGTRGTSETRRVEAAEAARILGVDLRSNLQMADGFFLNDETHQRRVISAIRSYQPDIILCNAPFDRHPDHGRSSNLVCDAAFLSGLMKISTEMNGKPQAAWRPKYVFRYIQDRMLQPDFVIDITDVFDQKIEAIKAYKTQFHTGDMEGPSTYISTPDFLDSVVYRHKWFGKMIGVKYAEGFISDKMIGFRNFDSFIKENT